MLVVDARDGERERERAQILDMLGAEVRARRRPPNPFCRTAPTSSSPRPAGARTSPLLAAAAAAGVPVWGEVELAWRLRPRDGAAPWLAVTGTNGKTTTVQMLAAMLRAAGRRAVAAGNVGLPLLEAVLHPDPYDVLAVELSSFQLHWSPSIAPLAGACLNVAPDHVDWHGSLDGLHRGQGPGLRAHPGGLRLQRRRPGDRAAGARRRRRRGLPGDRLHPRHAGGRHARRGRRRAVRPRVRRGAPHRRPPSWRRWPTWSSRMRHRSAPHNVANALAAAALARAYGVAAARRPRRAARLPRPARTASPSSPRSPASATSTTPRRPTRTPRPRRSPPSTRSSGSPADCPRAPTSTTWSGRTRAGCAASCCSATTAR